MCVCVKNVNLSEKQLPSKTNFSTFLQLNSFNFRLRLCERSYQLVKEIKFEGVWGDVEAKNRFHRKSFTKCLRLTPVLMRNSALQEKLNFCF